MGRMLVTLLPGGEEGNGKCPTQVFVAAAVRKMGTGLSLSLIFPLERPLQSGSARLESDSDKKRPEADFYSFEVHQTQLAVVFGGSLGDLPCPTLRAATMP